MALAACAASAPEVVAPTTAEAPVDAHHAEADAKALVAEVYQAVGHAQTDSLFTLLQAGIVMFGPRRLDAAANRANALNLLNKTGRVNHTMRSTGLSVVPSPGGHSAWMFDVVYVDTQPLAVTGVLTSTKGIWSVHATMMAAVPGRGQVKAQLAKDAVVPPGSSAAGQVDPGASEALDQFRRGLSDASVWATELEASEDAMWIGPASGELARGKDAIARAWKARHKSNAVLTTTGEFTAGRTPDGELVWLSASVNRSADDTADVVPERVFAIYAKQGAGWRLTALHEALALDEPGTGAAFKKGGASPSPSPSPTPAPTPAPSPGPSAPPEIEIETTASNDPKPAAADDGAKKAKTKKAKSRTTKKAAKKKPAKKKPAPTDDSAAPAADPPAAQ